MSKRSDIAISTFNRWFMVFKYNSPVNVGLVGSRDITNKTGNDLGHVKENIFCGLERWFSS